MFNSRFRTDVSEGQFWRRLMLWSLVAGIGLGWCAPVRADSEHVPTVQFVDVTEEAGLGEANSRASALWIDYDNDGHLDLHLGHDLYRNRGDGTFEKTDMRLPNFGVWADFTNDGRLEYFSARGAGQFYRDVDGSGRLVPVDMGFPGNVIGAEVQSTAAVADVNGDGLLDLYVTNYENPITPDQLFIAKPGGGFEEGINLLGEKGWAARSAVWGDFNNDGHHDLYVSNYRLQPNQLWVNDGRGRFTDRARELGAAGRPNPEAGTIPESRSYVAYTRHGHTISSYWGDLNNNGLLDLVVVNFSHPPAHQDRVKILINTGPPNYAFENLNRRNAAGIYWQESYAAGALGDFDNDGNLDLYVTTVYRGDRGDLFVNDGTGRFQSVGDLYGVRSELTYQVAWGDYNNNGFLDLMVGGRLYRNTGNDHAWLKVRLIGDGPSNLSAIGARVWVTAGPRQFMREVTASEGRNQRPLEQHIGLGAHDGPVTLRVRFPSGRQGQWQVEPRRVITVRESETSADSVGPVGGEIPPRD